MPLQPTQAMPRTWGQSAKSIGVSLARKSAGVAAMMGNRLVIDPAIWVGGKVIKPVVHNTITTPALWVGHRVIQPLVNKTIIAPASLVNDRVIQPALRKAIVAPAKRAANSATSAISAPIISHVRTVGAAMTAGLATLATNTGQKLNQLATETIPCAKAYGQLAQTLNETIETGSYLATAVAGLYIYNMANNGAGSRNLCGKMQKGIGLTMAVVAGACWLGRVAVNTGRKLFKGFDLSSMVSSQNF